MSEHAAQRLLIHVGLPKTGTTSLQVALNGAAGIRYIHGPDTAPVQSRQFANAVGVGEDMLGHDERVAWRDGFVSALRDETRPVVVSDETLSQVSRVDWSAFEEMLRRIGGEIRFVLVLRPFFSWLESLFNQFAKKGRMSILYFDPDADDLLSAYDIDFERIHADYSALAARLGPHCRVLTLRYSRDINRDICKLIGISPDCLDGDLPLNPSPSPQGALQSFLKARGQMVPPSDLRAEGVGFLGAEEIERLHRRHGAILARLSRRLGWPLEAVDDYTSFRSRAGPTSLLQIARSIIATAPENTQTMHEGDTDMADGKSENNRKIKGALARALLRAELKKGRDGQLSEEAFQAAWAARRDEMLDMAATLRQSLRRTGYDLVEWVPEAGEAAD